MSVRLTPEAVALVRRSLELARLDPAQAGVRLRLVGDDVQARFATAPQPGDEVVEAEGVRIFVDPKILAVAPSVEVGVAEHERLVVRPQDGG